MEDHEPNTCLDFLFTFNAGILLGNYGIIEADEPSADAAGLRIDSVLVSLIEQVEVPAREVGQLDKMLVKEGATVQKGDILAQIEAAESVLLLQQAKLE